MATAVDLLEYAIRSQLKWKRDGTDWVLWYGRHRVGHLVPDAKHPGMFRWAASSGRLSDMANISWVKYAVMGRAIRDLEWETRAVQIVKSEAGPDTVSREITCRSYGGPLPGREGKFVCGRSGVSKNGNGAERDVLSQQRGVACHFVSRPCRHCVG
jgi:hypothetical protein